MLRARQIWRQHLDDAALNERTWGSFVALEGLLQTRMTWFLREAEDRRSFAFELPCYVDAVRARYADDVIISVIHMLTHVCVGRARNVVTGSIEAHGALTEAACQAAGVQLGQALDLQCIGELFESAAAAEADPWSRGAWTRRVDRWCRGSITRRTLQQKRRQLTPLANEFPNDGDVPAERTSTP